MRRYISVKISNIYLIVGETGSFGKTETIFLLSKPETQEVLIFSRDEVKQVLMRIQYMDDPCNIFITEL